MIDYATRDAPIDALIWQYIADSPCPEDFRCYLRPQPEGALHLDEAIDRLIALDDADAACADDEARYPAAGKNGNPFWTRQHSNETIRKILPKNRNHRCIQNGVTDIA